jgi:hypothetical protein
VSGQFGGYFTGSLPCLKVYLTDENGNKTGQSRTLPEGADPKNLAIRMLRERVNTKRVSFNRPLVYRKHYY